MRKLAVGMDLDGVNFSFDLGYYNAGVTLGYIDPATPYRPSPCWDFYGACYGHSLPEFLANCHAAADAGLLWAGPMMSGAKWAWLRIAKAGHDIHVITDRSFGTHPAVSEVATRMWLRENELPYTSLTFTADKTAVRTDVMIEDKTANYDALDAVGCEVWLLDRPWNQEPGDGRRRVRTHAEFLRRVSIASHHSRRKVPA